MEARKRGMKALILPEQNAREAAIVQGLDILGVRNIKQVIDYFNDDIPIAPTTASSRSPAPTPIWTEAPESGSAT